MSKIALLVFGFFLAFSINFSIAAEPEADAGHFQILSNVRLQADGAGGRDAYDLIREKFGSGAIESPDLYANNHPGVKHIQEGTHAIVGHYFVFIIHRDLDHDRDRYPHVADRQRNEIKTYQGSAESVKGRRDETMRLSWKFYINPGMTVSRYFTHFFQLKPSGSGDDRRPLVTLTGFKNSAGRDIFEIRLYTPGKIVRLDQIAWTEVRGKWLNAHCLATFGENGRLRFDLTTQDGKVVLATLKKNIDLWPGAAGGEAFVRPKWGIYRSLKDRGKLREAPEVVYFSDFIIKKLKEKVKGSAGP